MSNLTQFLGGGIKSIQRGTVGAAGTVTITAVDVNKTVVSSLGTGSAGTVAASATVAVNSNASATFGAVMPNATSGSAVPTFGMTGSLSGGTTSGLFAGQYGCVLTNSTTLTANGACTYQVVEYF